ncbi:MAG: nitroreductase family protein, partial [Proteobacteria bacterium]|nr:nitroreductase family protein [Pseudomonadota bacterium]
MRHADNPVIAAMLERRSIRKFTGKAVAREDILTILEAGRGAPPGQPNQPTR